MDEVNGSLVQHVPVLVETLVEQISLPTDAVMVDATIGHGGHSFLFGRKLGKKGVIAGFDLDMDALEKARVRLEGLSCRVVLIHSNFSQISERLEEQGIERVNFILADLGLCSAQLADDKFGLSFQTNMPLDMRIDKRLRSTAADIVNRETEKNLADLIFKYGQDRASRRIARFITRERRKKPIATTAQLAEIICRALGKTGRSRKSRIHPATRTFQALRIAVNHELDNLERLLITAPVLLRESGKIAVISYHSLEDRLVKYNFKQNAEAGSYRIITKKPLTPSREEIAENRRARSAKLRIAEKQ
ncbi:MAG: 16S rRNA (cytosine(1402)-N(4))-methyltransferase RsmH [Sedimentisphaerales bacterium]|nr:16S rRNA (cytosine(1402)-N(4))-methyltransferase RsmH [Sedimentisphaerales bacterium]